MRRPWRLRKRHWNRCHLRRRVRLLPSTSASNWRGAITPLSWTCCGRRPGWRKNVFRQRKPGDCSAAMRWAVGLPAKARCSTVSIPLPCLRSVSRQERMAVLAAHGECAVFHDVECRHGHIKYMAALCYDGPMQKQFMVTAVALSGQRMIDGLVRMKGLLQCCSLTSFLAAGRLPRRFTQRTGRLLGKAIGRWRLAGIRAVLVHLQLERFQARQQRQNEDVLLLVCEPGKVGRGRFRCHATMMNWYKIVYNHFLPLVAAGQPRNPFTGSRSRAHRIVKAADSAGGRAFCWRCRSGAVLFRDAGPPRSRWPLQIPPLPGRFLIRPA